MKKGDLVTRAVSAGEALVDAGFAPDTAATREQADSLRRQLAKLEERAKNREEDLDNTLGKLEDFYQQHTNVLDDITDSNEAVRRLKPVGSDVESIKQQQDEFAELSATRLEPLGRNVDQCNRIGQGLIQTAFAGVNTSILEKDLEKMNDKWNTLKEKVSVSLN